MSDATEKAPFTVKALPVEARLRAVRAAKQRGETMAEWIARAIHVQADLEAGDTVFPPNKPNGKPAPAGGKPELTEDQRTARMHAMAAVMQGMAAVKAAGVRAWAQRDVVATLRLSPPPNGLHTEPSTAMGDNPYDD